MDDNSDELLEAIYFGDDVLDYNGFELEVSDEEISKVQLETSIEDDNEIADIFRMFGGGDENYDPPPCC